MRFSEPPAFRFGTLVTGKSRHVAWLNSASRGVFIDVSNCGSQQKNSR